MNDRPEPAFSEASSATNQSRQTRMPAGIVWTILAVSVLPLFLNLMGFDFGSTTTLNETAPTGQAPSLDSRMDEKALQAMSGVFVHTILEWSAFAVTVVVFVLALFNFYFNRDWSLPIIGIALLCAGAVDAFHILVSARLIEGRAALTTLSPFTWAIARVFHATILIAAVLALFKSQREKTVEQIRFLAGTGFLFAFVAFAVIQYCATSTDLPRTLYPESTFTRPWDLGPLLLYIIAGLFLFPRLYQRENTVFTHSLLVSMIPNIATQAYMAFGSGELFDNAFNVGHFLKIVAYLVPFVGLVLEYKNTLGTFVDTIEKNETTMVQLREAEALATHQGWVKTGISDLFEIMQKSDNLKTAAQEIVSFMVQRLEIQMGALYLAQDNALYYSAGYAYANPHKLPETFQFGEGYVGQAAVSKENILVREVPDEYFKIKSSLGEAPPKMLLFVPLVSERDVVGVLELCSLKEITGNHLDFVNQAADAIAAKVSLEIAQEKIKDALEETRAQAEELAQQQSELQSANQELEIQTNALKESEYKLVQQQEELHETNRQLEEQASILETQKQEIELKNEIVNQKVRELEIASKYKSEFLANMSHELRTPLNSMLILSRLLADNKDGNLTSKQEEFARTIHGSGNDLLNLINDILDLSKIESGNMEMILEEVDLERFVDTLNRNFQPLADDKNLDFAVELDPALPESMVCDAKHLEQVLRNLLSNAFKFTEKGGITVRISRPSPDTTLGNKNLLIDTTIAFSVTDTGKGIHESKRAQIFDAFQQEDGTTSRKYGGTGLGLSITREFVRLMGGEIQLESRLGEGSTFTVFIPEKVEPPVGILKNESVGGNGGNRPTLKKLAKANNAGESQPIDDDRQEIRASDRTLLIIEDDLKFAHVLKDMAREKGFKCLIADDGENGILLSQQFQPSAIILDVGLPGIDGLMVLEKLKNHPETKPIPVHFISAYEKDKEAMQLGAIGFLRKPVTQEKMDEVFSRIEKVLSKSIKNLLVIEDETVVQDEIQKMLGNSKTNVLRAITGEDGLKALEENEVDCIVLDLHLDGISGFDFLEQIKKKKKLKNIPVIVYTGRELTPDEEVKLKRYSESIIIKGAHSLDRLIDEATLFLHKVAETGASAEGKRGSRVIESKDYAGKKILLVDDDLKNLFALAHVLEEYEMNVIIAKHGREGLEQLQEHRDIDLVLMDIMMPEMDGYECMREIRKIPEFKNLPIIALTAKAMKGDKEKCLQAGANDYLTKPVDINILLNQIRIWVLHGSEH
ncbi:Putative signal transduction histidine kinase (modular protein) [Nitrospina gracilis 3/211]|uniref:histidine kinase n=1 Tax=Nitrospina gracilis (strain 3/211) TaxID=1266370 RepID=M1YZU8_NITG3|nr:MULTISPECIES: response regulator [Nitrospina]MCF8724100.1 signal transduction histidine kinase/CheY-like chemotaxis protein [Nitrospina sp. Nb-3]CCQ91242.1 Putative signal transduction histidine kinase (modular protein) [Nitrospina gracilis 3/211]